MWMLLMALSGCGTDPVPTVEAPPKADPRADLAHEAEEAARRALEQQREEEARRAAARAEALHAALAAVEALLDPAIPVEEGWRRLAAVGADPSALVAAMEPERTEALARRLARTTPGERAVLRSQADLVPLLEELLRLGASLDTPDGPEDPLEAPGWELTCGRPDDCVLPCPEGTELVVGTGDAACARDGVKEGPGVQWRRDGGVAAVGAWKAGREDGPWRIFEKDGVLDASGSYVEGVRQGPWQRWWPAGTLRDEVTYADGKVSGSWRVWATSGALVLEGAQRDGRACGPILCWDGRGAPEACAASRVRGCELEETGASCPPCD